MCPREKIRDTVNQWHRVTVAAGSSAAAVESSRKSRKRNKTNCRMK